MDKKESKNSERNKITLIFFLVLVILLCVFFIISLAWIFLCGRAASPV
jgi:hypothetical protein